MSLKGALHDIGKVAEALAPKSVIVEQPEVISTVEGPLVVEGEVPVVEPQVVFEPHPVFGHEHPGPFRR